MSPKATIQATLLSLASTKVRQMDPPNTSFIDSGKILQLLHSIFHLRGFQLLSIFSADNVASMGALAIILTAPTFAFAIPFFGKRLIVSQEAAVAPVDTVPTTRESIFETAYLTVRASFLSNLNYGVLGGQQRDANETTSQSLLSSSQNGGSFSMISRNEDSGVSRRLTRLSVLSRVASGRSCMQQIGVACGTMAAIVSLHRA